MALRGIKVVEMAGLAPAPFCGMILSDFGADVIRIDKSSGPSLDRLGRGKRSIAVDLKSKEGLSIIQRLCSTADVLIEPFRPGVMEKLGLGPNQLLSSNPRLIYARLTGFGQTGPYSSMAGHDINYVAVSGLLSLLGRNQLAPIPPQNMLADFAGGGLMCAMGIVMALFERERSKVGQVIDAAMVDGAAYVGSWIFKSQDMPIWSGSRGHNWFDGGLHYYETYETSDGKYMTVGALEPQFYGELERCLKDCGFENVPGQFPDDAEQAKGIMRDIFLTKTQQEWQEIFDGRDACVAPVVELQEADQHIHNSSRKTFLRGAKGLQPAPAPRLSRTPAVAQTEQPEPAIGQHSAQVLLEIGYTQAQIDGLISKRVVKQARPEAKL